MTDVAEPIGVVPPMDAGGLNREQEATEGPTLGGALVLRMRPPAKLTARQFVHLCHQNPNLRLERTAEGDVIIMPPAHPDTSDRNADLTTQLRLWAKKDDTGVAYDATAGFMLPNGAERSPDASWVQKERLEALTPEQRSGFWQICPDFVVELRSTTDRMATLRKKMQEYLDNGARLGWLIDPLARRIYVYRPGQAVELLENPATVSGDPVLPGFVLDAPAVFDPSF
jgi:Uma2 family endonuclease